MFYIVYKTTNVVNGKVYIGAHQTKNLDDGYLGSGYQLRYAIKKYGKDSFTQEILFNFENRQEMYDKERELVTEDFISEKTNYNIRIGGQGGFNFINRTSESHRSVMRTNRLKTNQILQDKYGDDWHTIITQKAHTQSRIVCKEKWENDPDYVQMIKNNLKKGTFAAQSEEAKLKRKETWEKKKINKLV